MTEDTPARSALGSAFDRTFRSLHGLPDTVCTKATTIRAVSPVLELAQTFIVQTYRKREVGDTIFIEFVGTEGSVRVALPPEVSEVIARQRDALGAKNRRLAAKAEAARRKAQGIQPGFLRAKATKKTPKKKGGPRNSYEAAQEQ